MTDENCQITIKRKLDNSPDPEQPVMVIYIKVLVRFEEGEYIASFPEAHMAISAESEDEALFELGGMIVDSYKELKDIPDGKLGPAMQHAKQVLIGHFNGNLGSYEYQSEEIS